MKKISYILYSLVALAAVILPVREWIDTGTVLSDSLIRSGAMLLIALLGFRRAYRNDRKRAHKNQIRYKEEFSGYIGDIFPEDESARNRFFDAVDAYVNKNPGKGRKILKALSATCKTDPERYAVAVFSGFCLHNLEQYDQALEQYRTALSLRPDSTIASNMGVCCEKLGLGELALRYYRVAVTLNPDNPLPNSNLAQMCIRSGDYAQGMVYATHALSTRPDMLPALTAMAVCCHKLGRTADYQKYLKKVVDAGGDEAKLQSYLQTLE